MSIVRDPRLQEADEVVRTGECVAFVGSGLSSKLYPSWKGLIQKICDACNVETPDLKGEVSSSLLLNLADKAHQENPEMYQSVLSRVFGRPIVDTRITYDYLMRAPFKSYVTHNFDPLLAHESRKEEHGCNGVHVPPYLPIQDINRSYVFYIHGLIQEDEQPEDVQVVLSKTEFEQAYSEGSPIPSFLEQLLAYNPVVFIGCQLRESAFEPIFRSVIEIQKRVRNKFPGVPKHARYILLPTKDANRPSNENDTISVHEREEREHFAELEIQIVRYDQVDEKHSGLVRILESWSQFPPLKVGPEPRPALDG